MASIRSIIDSTWGVKTAEVVLLMRTAAYRDKVMVIVEGDDDVKLYGKFFNIENTHLHDLGGCTYFKQVLSDLSTTIYSSRFIVIKDSDFDILNGTAYYYRNLFFTDAHDAEMMIMLPQYVDSLSINYLHYIEPTLFDESARAIENLSYLKWYSIAHIPQNNRICFDSITVDKTWYKSMTDCHAIVYGHADNISKTPVDVADVISFTASHSTADRKHLLNGHDMCCALMDQIKSIRMQNIRKKAIPQHFRESYTIDDFKTTNLYHEIVSWFAANRYTNPINS